MRMVLVALSLLLVGPKATFAQTIPGLTERVVDVAGHRMQVWIGGPAPLAKGPPLVIFENGWNSTVGSWSRVAAEVAKFAPVLPYNRGGYGKSEWDGELPTPEHVARRLHALLKVLDLAPPHLLVGHSWGGPLIRMHATLYPDSIAGLVYVDPSSGCILEKAFETAGVGARAAEFIDRQERQDWAGVHPRDVPAPEPTTRISLPDVPVVLAIGLKVAPPAGPQTQWFQERGIDPAAIATGARQHKIPCLSPLAMEVPRGLLVATPFSGDVIQQDEPDLVVWAIRRVLTATSKKPASGQATQTLATQSAEKNSAPLALINVTIIDGTGVAPRPG
jgi:pimeloyl-ACP methyl ester carboxylesterase